VKPPAARLLAAAIEQFGRLGLDGATTRAIAQAASTPMSQITYHFGGKEGLYLAAARHIAEEVSRRVGTAVLGPSTHVTDPASKLLAMLDGYTQVLLSPEIAAWAPFIVREQLNPTPAFEILYSNAIGKVVDCAAALIAAVSDDRCNHTEARIRAIAVIGQALVFRLGRATVLRSTGWGKVGHNERDTIRAIVRAHTASILADLSAASADA